MADSQPEYFPAGAIVQCVTCLGEKIEGEVVAFDRILKLLALKTSRQTAGSKKSRVQQLQMINMNLVQEVSFVQEAPPASSQAAVPNFNYGKISKRAFEEAARKRRSICSDSVSPEGQKLFITIRKTIEDVQWDGENIVVMSTVIVSAPYKTENVEVSVSDDQRQQHRNITRAQAQNTADHLKKIIDQFWLKQREDTCASPAGNSSESSRKSEPPETVEIKRSSPS